MSSADTVRELQSVQEFFFNAPLYAKFQVPVDLVDNFYTYKADVYVVDGYCPYCGRDTPFEFQPVEVPYIGPQTIPNRVSWDRITLRCKGDNWSELYKAIGLAAHGEGIGSFVYLRRVFERLMKSRFDEHKKEKGWKDEEFQRLHMDQKVEFLKEYLPDYLVQARKIYSIFSLGIHELDNQTCLEFFEVGKRSIIYILEDDLKKKEEERARKELAEAIAKFTPGTQKVDKTTEMKK